MNPIVIDRDAPWANWSTPEVRPVSLSELTVHLGDNGFTLYEGDEVIADATHRGLQEMSRLVGFDTDFVTSKLPGGLAADVINHRIAASKDKTVAVITEDGRFTSLVPSVRELLTYSETAQEVYDLMNGVYGDIHIDFAGQTDRGMHLRLMTDIQQRISPATGDVMGMGIDVRQDYGETTNIRLYLRRLVCLNGLSAQEQAFSWQNRLEGGRDYQRLFLADGIARALGAYDNIVDRSRVMAQTPFEGTPEEALRLRATAMNFPLRNIGDVIQAFEMEPGETEWHLLNAFTRVGTHSALPGQLGQRTLQAAGEWANNFDIVTCRMPRPMAVKAGAQIVD